MKSSETYRLAPRRWGQRAFTLMLVVILLMGTSLTAIAVPPPGNPATYTLDTHFSEGTLVNVNYSDVPDQLQLDSVATPFEFIWVAASGRGTVIKIDTVTGAILGEYWSAPQDRPKNPSRTTVDNDGNVWAGNRDEASGGKGSVVHIGLVENGQCVDRNTNGVIETSTGLGDIRNWPNAGGADTNGGVSTAQDECIIHYVRTSGTNVRTVAVNENNDVWMGGYGNKVHELYDGATGAPVAGTQFSLGCGGYGGLYDGNGVLWSANLSNTLLRYDTSTSTGACKSLGRYVYGLGIDTNGYIWNSNYTSNTVAKIQPDGLSWNFYGTGGASGDRGVAVTPADNNIWVANSGGSDVSRLNNAGGLVVTIGVGSMPTGVAVDAEGKVWVTNYSSHSAMRIDPATNLVDLTVNLGGGAYPYNYSDMTGSTLIAPPGTGTWSVVHDSGTMGAKWRDVSWNSLEPSDSSITVKVASSADGLTFGPEVAVSNGDDPYLGHGLAAGQYLKVIVSFSRASTSESPILYDLTIQFNEPPAADADGPYLVAVDSTITLDGTGTDPDDTVLTYAWTATAGTFDDASKEDPDYTAGSDAGIFDLSLQVTDPYGASDTADAQVVVYDPSAGFVTGGGWIDSPPGAYAADTQLTGKATFGFVSNYKKGKSTPEGNTEFQFHAADLNFHSDSYEWLVIAGHQAKYKGTGTINGGGNYGFMLTAVDEALTPSTDEDTFRIKIWDKDNSDAVVYDNKMGVDDDSYDGTSLSGGSIVIHTNKK